MNIIYGSEKSKILEKLKEQYGILDIPFLLVRFGKDKIRGYSGNLSTDEIYNINNSARIALLGLYLFSEQHGEFRLSLDALHLFKDQITKNIIELDDKEAEEWNKGLDLPIKEEWKKLEKNFKVIKHKGDFIGTGKLTIEKITNYLPKERRVKDKTTQ